jgi:hypothetical protein
VSRVPLEHLPNPDREKLDLVAQGGHENLRSACENFQQGDAVTTPVSQLAFPGGCPDCMALTGRTPLGA